MKHPSLKEKLAIAVLAFVASISWIVPLFPFRWRRAEQ